MKKHVKEMVYRHPMGTLRVFCSVLLLLLLGVCGYMGAARRESVQSVVGLPVTRTELEGDAIGGSSMTQIREKMKRQRMEELALLDSVIADAGTTSAAKEDALTQKAQIVGRMELETQATAILEGMGAEDALVISGAQGLTMLLPQKFGLDETTRNRLLNAVGGLSGMENGQLKIILIKK